MSLPLCARQKWCASHLIYRNAVLNRFDRLHWNEGTLLARSTRRTNFRIKTVTTFWHLYNGEYEIGLVSFLAWMRPICWWYFIFFFIFILISIHESRVYFPRITLFLMVKSIKIKIAIPAKVNLSALTSQLTLFSAYPHCTFTQCQEVKANI